MVTPSGPDRLTAALSDRYRLERELGQGGMATVYLAEDLKHHRKVAIKVLKPDLAAVLGADRFVQEITTTAALQHPHILPLFDSGTADGFLFYVMPFVEGETLRAKLDRERQLGIDESVRVAREVADALDYAHRHGVIHRDIKPENILLHDGRATVADFGIALAVSAAAGGRMTETGLSLGTPHYMSPEQATAEREITGRSDIYSLGCVLYEMLTGEPPHMGTTAQQIIMKIITEPAQPVTRLRKSVPHHIADAVAQAVEKLPADRFATAKEFADALIEAGTTARRPGRSTRLGHHPPTRPFAVLALIALAAVAAGLLLGRWLWAPAPPSAGVIRVTMSLPESLGVRATPTHRVTISSDGRRLAWTGGPGPLAGLVVRDLDQELPRYLPGTEGAMAPFFSPDGQQIGFFVGRGTQGSLRVVPADGGTVRTILSGVEPWGGDWTEDGMIYFTNTTSTISRVPAGGGAATVVSVLDSTLAGVTEHDFVQVLPGGRGALVQLWRGGISQNQVGVLDFATGRVDTLVSGGFARYLRSGHVLYVTADGRLHILPFDTRRLRAAGAPIMVVAGVAMENLSSAGQFAVSRNGTLVYQSSVSAGRLTPSWVTRTGQVSVVDSGWTVDATEGLALSPDGRRVAINHVIPDGSHLWLKTLPRGPFTRLTFSGASNDRPSWSPDGRRIAFLSEQPEVGRQAFQVDPDAGTPPLLLARYPGRMDEALFGRSPAWLLGRTFGAGTATRKLLAQEVGRDTAMRLLFDGPADMYAPALSPDGRWLAFVSEESGQAEVYVRPFPDVASARWQVSVAGGREPLWSRDGRELFYRTERGEVMTVPVTVAGGALVPGSPIALFTDMAALASPFHRNYDVAADGRFLMLRQTTGASRELQVVFNWFEELQRIQGGR